MSYLDDAALHAVSEKATFFVRINKEDVWYRCVLPKDQDWDNWYDYEEVVRLEPDGTGLYIVCKEYPMKRQCFRKLKETMTMIALKAHSL